MAMVKSAPAKGKTLLKTLSAEELLERILAKKELPARLLIQGDDAFLTREIRNALAKNSLDVTVAEFKKGGPEREQEDLSMGSSLFASASMLWVSKCPALSSWKAENKQVWKRMVERADGESFYIWVQVPLDRRANWSGLELEAESGFDVGETARPAWLKWMNRKQVSLHGGGLSPDKLEFLHRAFDEELLTYDNWIELWSLGGDAWAEVALGWSGDSKHPAAATKLLAPNENAAFSWVDCVLMGSREQRARGQLLLEHLLEQGQEPLQLLGLISKSIRILSMIERDETPQGQPDFLVSKMKGILRTSSVARRNRAAALLARAAEVDRLLKSSSSNARALLTTLSTI